MPRWLLKRWGADEMNAMNPVVAGGEEDGKHLVIIIGFGPAGQRVARDLGSLDHISILVVDLRPGNIDLARSMGFHAVPGDATHLEFLIHHGVIHAKAIVITVPDHRAIVRMVGSIRTLNDEIAIIARARYHAFVDEIYDAGATMAIDEEQITGRRLTAAVRQVLIDRSKREDDSRGLK